MNPRRRTGNLRGDEVFFRAAAAAGAFQAVNPIYILLLGLAFFAGAGHAESINGHSYISLAGWARANGFGGGARNGGAEFILTNKTSRLVFAKDSADSTLNGVNVRLSFPVAKGGFISQLDVDKALRPLVFPQKPSLNRNTYRSASALLSAGVVCAWSLRRTLVVVHCASTKTP